MNYEYIVVANGSAPRRDAEPRRLGPYTEFQAAAEQAKERSQADASAWRIVRRDLNAADEASDTVVAVARRGELVEAAEGKPLLEDDEGQPMEPPAPAQPASS